MRYTLLQDKISPVISELYLTALDRRLEKVLEMVRDCITLHGDGRVLVDKLILPLNSSLQKTETWHPAVVSRIHAAYRLPVLEEKCLTSQNISKTETLRQPKLCLKCLTIWRHFITFKRKMLKPIANYQTVCIKL